MDDQFDNKLSNRIREVFDNYEYPPAEHGWAELRKKFPAEEKHNKVAWLWWSSAAAIILVMLGIGLWYNGTDSTQNNYAVKPVVKKPVKDSVIKNPTIAQQPVIAKTEPVNVKPSYVSPYVQSLGVSPRNTYRPNTAAVNSSVIQQPAEVAKTENSTAIAQTNSTPAASVVTTAVDSAKNIDPVVQQPQLAQSVKPAENSPIVQSQQNAIAATATQKPKQTTIMDMFEQEKKNKAAQRNLGNKQGDKKVTFAVYATTYFNYSEGSSNQMNAGAGVSSDFRLSKKLKLSTGVALAQNSLNYGSAAAAPQSAFALASKARVLNQEGLFAMSAALPVFRNYNVSMLGIDVPVNLKYEFNPDKTDAFISAGLSSGTFFDESYTYKYTYSNGTVANSAAASEDHNETAHSSNNFYFGKMLNVSFGIGYPVGNNRLIVEPFVKYPLGGLGAQDIRFGSGGVNLKFSFKGGKR
ncbi:MAG: outer membrane beta-barrel protein [Mucilaginibacter sp.]|nr:outer membrane beta-barrel protein [Mucilaginibacter sp.]